MRARRWLGLATLALGGCVPFGGTAAYVYHEQRCLDVRQPEQLPHAPVPPTKPPETVTNRFKDDRPKELSLDDVIRISLANSKVVRLLAGVTAVSSGQTIYDPAIANTAIDEAKAAFDPIVSARNTLSRSENPSAIIDPANPAGVTIEGPRIDNYDLGLGVAKRTLTGGTFNLDATENIARFTPEVSPLDPLQRSALTLSYTQPLLQGAGIEVNLAPIVIARINTERSYFQFKDAVQELVRGTIEAYWNVVYARTALWTARQQVQQGETAYARAEARQRRGLGNAAELAQSKLALSNFRANQIGAEANLLQREAALRNIMGLPPTEPDRFTPSTPPTPVRIEPKWDELVRLAEERRPDIVELKLILEADNQQLIVARNNAQPRLDATMLYRWNGLEGKTPQGVRVASGSGQFTDWSLGVNFSVPLGLRASRAGLRRTELLIFRDRANLEQGLHAAVHELAESVRGLAQFHEQYKAYLEARKAARSNLEQQVAEYRADRTIFLNVLQAITDWGNAVSSEAQALAQYNIELARLERRTGTILECHRVYFSEERFRSLGPLGCLGHDQCYPEAVVPGPNADRYPTSSESSEAALEKELPSLRAPAKPEPQKPVSLP
ncbi:MAG: TolC family protein [Gemmataceae bacterium]